DAGRSRPAAQGRVRKLVHAARPLRRRVRLGPGVMLAEAGHDAEDLAQIRASVRALCEKFPGEYWRALDRDRAYRTAFVQALTEAGFLAALIPEEYGGSGLTMRAAAAIMEEIQASGCNGAACHAQMYTMGTVLRHGSAEQKARYLPAIAAGS